MRLNSIVVFAIVIMAAPCISPLSASDVATAENSHEQRGVRVASVNAFYSGGNTVGGSHPAAAAWSFTVPEGKNRLLLVVTNAKADPALSGQKSLKGHSISQRAMLTSLTYAGKPLQCMTTFDKATYDDRHAVFWYLVDPPMGTANLEAIQFRRDNGGELFAAVFALTGVSRENPLGQPLHFQIERKQEHGLKCRTGGLVVAEANVIKLANPDPSQVVRYANNQGRLGSTAVSSPEVKLSWDWPKEFLTKQRRYRAAPKNGDVNAIAIHPRHEFREDPRGKSGEFAFEPSSVSFSEERRPGLAVTLYDLSAIATEEIPRGINYQRPRCGYRIPKHFRKQKVLAREIVPNVDYKYDFKHDADLKYDRGFMNSGVRDHFVAEFTGTITLPESGQYVFELNSNDQAKLYLDEHLIIDNRGNNTFTMKMASLRLRKGNYQVRVVHIEEQWKENSSLRPHGVRLGWRPPSGYPKDMPIQLWKLEKGVHPIPASAFSH